MPTPKISLRDFRSLLHRRSKALSRLHSPTATSSNPNPSSYSNQQNGAPKENPSFFEPKLEAEKIGDCGEGPSGEEKDQRGSDGGGDCPMKLVDASDPLPEKASGAIDGVADEQALPVETKLADLANLNSEVLLQIVMENVVVINRLFQIVHKVQGFCEWSIAGGDFGNEEICAEKTITHWSPIHKQLVMK
jgi:hypothetical protein